MTKAEKAAATAKSAASSAKQSAMQAAEAASERAESVADDAVSLAADRARQIADQGKSRTEEIVRAVSRAFEAGSQSLEDDGMTGTAGYVRAAANGLNRAAEEVDGVNTGGMTQQVENFVRERPMLTMGALAIAGFAFAGALKNNNNR